MKLSTYLPEASSIKSIRLLLLSLAFGIVFMANVAVPSTGLDPSWQLGLSLAHAEGLQWGKDVIFTFGPFGYLFYGSLVEKSFFEMQVARYILASLWIFYSLRFALSFNSLALKVTGVLCLILIPSLANNIESHFVFLIQLIILDIFTLYKKKIGVLEGLRLYLYGVISIFLLLIKSSFGILSVISFSTVVLLNGFFEFKKNRNFIAALHPTIWLFSGCLIGLSVFFSSLANSPSSAILIAFLPGALVGFLLSNDRVQSFLSGKNALRGIIVVIICLLFLAAYLAFENASLREFILGSLSISSGYSQSMSAIGPATELYIGFILLLTIVAFAITAIFCDPLRNTGVAFALLALAWVSFKHGFIRHDAHALGFSIAVPAYLFNFSSLIFPYLVSKRLHLFKPLFFSVVSFCVVLVIGFGIENPSISKYYNFNLKDYAIKFFHPQALHGKLFALIQPELTEATLINQTRISLEPSTIESKAVLSKVKDKTVDILPVELSIAKANSLQWHPSPVFQSYAAYTRWLDQKNLKAYQEDPPERIIYSLQTIDARHPYFDQPQTTLFQICNYRPFQFKKQPSLESTGDIAVLKERNVPLCSLDDIINVGQSLAVAWGESIDLNEVRELYNHEPGNFLLLSVDLQYSLVGKLYNFLLRTPPVYLKVIYENGFTFDFRLVIDNARSNFIVGHLPLSLQEALRDFDGFDALNKIQSISLSCSNPSAFAKTINLKFSRLKKQIILPKGFNSSLYLELNPDLKQYPGLNAEAHFLTSGFFEGRRYK